MNEGKSEHTPSDPQRKEVILLTHLIITLARYVGGEHARFSMCIRIENYDAVTAKYHEWTVVGVSAYDEYVPLTN